MDLGLAGKTALVTGASIGIGRGIAVALAREGAKLAVVARRRNLLEDLEKELKTKLVIIDLPRPPSPLHLLRLATMLPLAPFVPFVHDGVISSLRTYSPSALRALAQHAGSNIELELRGGLVSPQVAVATRR